jgi:hypothetical protein
MHRKHTVIIDWNDRGVEDADEIVVFADSSAQAIKKAKEKWRTTIGLKWPHCRIVEARAYTRQELQKLA